MSNRILIKSIVVLVVICLVISGALAVVNHFTAPVIRQARAEREMQSRQALIPQAAEFKFLPVEGFPASVTAADLALDADGRPVGYVFRAEGKGFNGTIVVMAAIDGSGRLMQVSTVDVTSETATLGGQTAKESYTAQYQGVDASLEGVNAISGATVTSKAYEQCVLDCFTAFQTVKEAEK